MIEKLAGVAFGGVLLGVAAGAVAPSAAHADPVVPSGQYQYVSDGGGNEVWTFTPCGPDCTVAKTPDGDADEFRLGPVGWSHSGPEEGTADGGCKILVDQLTAFDPVSLVGIVKNTVNAPACGVEQGSAGQNTFQLTKIG